MPNTIKRHLRDPEATTAHGRPLPLCRKKTDNFTDDPATVTCGTCRMTYAALRQYGLAHTVMDGRLRRTGSVAEQLPPVPATVHLRDVVARDPWHQALCKRPASAFATLPSEATCGICQRMLARSIATARTLPERLPLPPVSPPRQEMPRTRPESRENRPTSTRHPNITPVVIAPSDSPYSASTPIRAWVRQRRSDTPAGPVCVDGTQAHRRRVAWENGIERGVCRLCGDVKIYHQEVEANVWH